MIFIIMAVVLIIAFIVGGLEGLGLAAIALVLVGIASGVFR